MSHANPAKHARTRATTTRAAATASGKAFAIGALPGDRTSGLVRSDNRSADELAFDNAVVSYFIDAAEMLGVPKSVAAIYGICFASPEPLSFSDINERLEISSGSISQGLRVLREVGALKIAPTSRTVEPLTGRAEREQQIDGSAVKQLLARSRDRYEPDLELRNLVLHWIEMRLQKQLSSGRNRLQEIVNSLSQTDGAFTTLRVRFESLQTWQDKAHSLLPIAKTFLKLT